MLNKININTERQKLIVYLGFLVITFAVFWQVNKFDFITFDDQVYVTENLSIQSGITTEGIRWAFTTKYFGLWNPLVWLSLMADYQLFGLKAGGYHLTNLIFHIFSTLLLFWLFHRMTKEIWKSAFVAGMFALHPLHVESVAWIAERKDVLSAFFGMLTLCFYVYYTENPGIKRYLLLFFSFVFALMSKPMVVTLPVVMILLDYWPLKRFPSKQGGLILWQLKEKLPLFTLSAVVSMITLYYPNNASAVYYSVHSRITNALVSFVQYLEKTFWPYDLAVFYPFSMQFPRWQIIGAAFIITIIAVCVICMLKRLPYLFVGWFWFSVMLAPVIGIIQIGNYAMADRYHYLPSIGLTIMLAWSIPSLLKGEQIRKYFLFPAGIVFLTIMAILAYKQCNYWMNSISLFDRALQVTKNNYLAHNSMGIALLAEGKHLEAIDHFSKVILIRPDFVRSYNNRGVVYAEIGQYEKAINDYNKATLLDPYSPEVYNNRGIVFNKLGWHQRAITEYNKAIHLKHYYAEAYNNRGNTLFSLGQYRQAVIDYNEAIRIQPRTGLFYDNRANAYFHRGDNKFGCTDATKACELGNCNVFNIAKAQGLCR